MPLIQYRASHFHLPLLSAVLAHALPQLALVTVDIAFHCDSARDVLAALETLSIPLLFTMARLVLHSAPCGVA